MRAWDCARRAIPMLFLTDPNGVDREVRRKMLDCRVNEINPADPMKSSATLETNSRIAQYELAFRMQSSVPELADLSKEPQSTWDLYGADARRCPAPLRITA